MNVVKKMHNEILRQIFRQSVQSVQPQTLIKNNVKVKEGHLWVKEDSYPLRKPLYVVGFGKAALGMSSQLERVLGQQLQRALVVIPSGTFERFRDNKDVLPVNNSRIEFMEGAENNLPDANAMKAAQRIKQFVGGLEDDDFVIILISGGGSALLPLPVTPITLDEKLILIKNLGQRGADITELNCVRKQISELKGGGLADLTYPRKTVALILSDVVQDPLDIISSGPTTPDHHTPEDALNIIKKYSLYEKTATSIKNLLEQKNQSFVHPTAPIVNGKYAHVENYIIGNNTIAANQAKAFASEVGFQSAVLSTKIDGDVGVLAKIYANLARYVDALIANSSDGETLQLLRETLQNDLHVPPCLINDVINMDFRKKTCLILGGETTVVVKGGGKGGRNQQLALAFSLELNKLEIKSANISMLSCGTDGIDGPTDAAGAIGNCHLVADSLAQNIKPEDYLNDCDSYNFFNRFDGGRNLVRIGHTGTNVMDIHVILIEPK